MVLAITISYAVQRFQVMQEYADSTHLTKIKHDANYLQAVNNTEHGINFSVGFLDARTYIPGIVLHHGYVELQIFSH